MTRLHEAVLYLHGLHHPGEPINLPLDLTPAPTLNVTAPRERKKELTAKAFECLRLLTGWWAIGQSACVKGWQFEEVAGRRFGARLGELREFLAREAGREFVPASRGRQRLHDPIRMQLICGGREGAYTLEDWARPAAEAALANYDKARNIPGQAS